MLLNDTRIDFQSLKISLAGDFFTDISTLIQYATDASAYRELPLAVSIPKGKSDLKLLVAFAKQHKVGLIPRTAGTSLAGQVVGNGIIVDFSKYWNKILDINTNEHWVIVEPGVILDELNQVLKVHELFFGPETSTGNRCMLGGMLGNNSCGSHSLVYGSSRDHTLSVKMMLDDGNEYEFGPITKEEYNEKLRLQNREGDIYRSINELLQNETVRNEIADQYPKPSIKRRNTGYALDLLTNSSIFKNSDEGTINLCNLIAGSEGTLGFVTQIKLNLVPLPPNEKGLLCIHLANRNEAFKANLIALKYNPSAVELMDNIILECTKHNIEQRKNRFFIQGDPGAVLIIELWANNRDEIQTHANIIEADMLQNGYGYHFPIVYGTDMAKVWALRKAGLGVLSNIEGDAKPVSLIEDTAVDPTDLPNYMEEFETILNKYKLDCVYHAHIGSGELHLRPVLNLKDDNDVSLFRTIAFEVAHLVKKYKGSLSGEHGDGRLRGELIPIMFGSRVYGYMQKVKNAWDPNFIFNPGKIINTPPLHTNLRYSTKGNTRTINTIFSFDTTQGILGAAERCNGSGDCRKTENAGGTMCPSYMATRDEWNSTRARANILREFLTNSNKSNPFDHPEIYQILDQCLSCKGCKSECPSSVDMAKLKAEFLYQWYKSHRISLRSWLIANISKINALGSIVPKLFNLTLRGKATKWFMDRFMSISAKRDFPKLNSITLKKWIKKNTNKNHSPRKVYLFADEFTNFTDVEIGKKAYNLLTKLNYNVQIASIKESGRAYISKGLLATAKRIANGNIRSLKDTISQDTPLIGIEPSAILSFRDEYPELVSDDLKATASEIAKSCMLFEEFFVQEVNAGRILKQQFSTVNREIKLHGHCQQKAIASTKSTIEMLSFPEGHKVSEIPSGCCGMAGSFGFEKEHYNLSMKVGELVLFPEVRAANNQTTIAAAGTSCRHQIMDGTERKSSHPVEIMWEALIKDIEPSS